MSFHGYDVLVYIIYVTINSFINQTIALSETVNKMKIPGSKIGLIPREETMQHMRASTRFSLQLNLLKTEWERTQQTTYN